MVEFIEYTNNEERAETYLMEQGLLKIFKEYSYCQNKRINPVGDLKINVTRAIENGELGRIASSKG